MAPRRRISKNSDLPVGLHTRIARGRLRYYFIREDGTEKWFPAGVSRTDACAAAHEYNRKYRIIQEPISKRGDKYNKRLAEWLPVILKRIRTEEKLGNNAISTLEKDIERLSQLHGNVFTKQITLEHVNEYLDAHCKGKSNNVYNRKISFLKKVFDYLCDMSAMDSNPAILKKVKPKEKKVRTRLSLEAYQAILNAAPAWLQVAMKLSLQTTHAVLEVSRIKYRDCNWFDVPDTSGLLPVFGVLKIHRQKVAGKEASRVAIPITPALKQVFDESRDRVLSPYVVHRQKTDSNPLAAGLTHETQLSTRVISSTFSKVRDELKLYDSLPVMARPTFHEIRALSIHLFTQQGIDPQARAAHTDSKSTKIYQRDHVEWVQVPAAELVIDAVV